MCTYTGVQFTYWKGQISKTCRRVERMVHREHPSTDARWHWAYKSRDNREHLAPPF